ncbi:hypothetical protein Agub_g14393, partial [Astrephomene gubernaculifera]
GGPGGLAQLDQLAGLSLNGSGMGGGGGGGGGAAPSLARESLRSVRSVSSSSSSERGTSERVETASVKHFKGIPPRLVEMYRRRAQSAHWALAADTAALSRITSRRGSIENLAASRPMGLARQSAPPVTSMAAATAAAAAAAAGGSEARTPLLNKAHYVGSSSSKG